MGESLELTAEALDGPAGGVLVAALLDELRGRYEEEDPDEPLSDELAPPAGAFFVARLAGEPVGCGGLRDHGAGVAELKRMYTVPTRRRTGVARRMLAALEAEARRLGYRSIVLETGVRQPEAIALYERHGYRRIANFGPYEQAPLSVCFGKQLRSDRTRPATP